MAESADRHRLPFGIAPRLLGRDAAAAYCGMSSDHFDRHVARLVPPLEFGAKLLWDVRALDKWLDALSGLAHAPKPWAEWLGALDGDQNEGR